MRAREVLKLQEGDVITCNECPKLGCDGREAKVEIRTLGCGCQSYYHARNKTPFFWINHPGCQVHKLLSWGVRLINSPKGSDPLTGRSIKLVRRAGE